jgi:hypothetical protein
MSDNLETLKSFLPLIGVLLTGGVGLVTYNWQEATKRQTELSR